MYQDVSVSDPEYGSVLDREGELPPPDRQVRRRRRALISLFLLALSMYLLTTSGEIQTIDYSQEVKVSASMASGHGFVVHEPVVPGGGVQPGRDGRTYA